ncbi:hypothetical protein ACQWF9_27780, partial [Salmonella enterica subsp. enterica serovar Infantis]
PVSELPNHAFLLALLEQALTRHQTTALLSAPSETGRDTAGELQETHREKLLQTMVHKLT